MKASPFQLLGNNEIHLVYERQDVLGSFLSFITFQNNELVPKHPPK